MSTCEVSKRLVLLTLLVCFACSNDREVHGPAATDAGLPLFDTALDDSELADAPQPDADANTDVPPPICGDGACQASERCETCPGDCGVCGGQCGDGKCNGAAGEYCGTCSQDCGPCKASCGDFVCDTNESAASCPGDCKPSDCGEGTCSYPTETCTSCPGDCGKCGKGCSDGLCDADLGETCYGCPVDCGPCGGPDCGDGLCQPGESPATCDQDCGGAKPKCGDGICAFAAYESCATCPQDCPCINGCGNGVCKGEGKTCVTCPMDCGACPGGCGNGTCEAEETCQGCPADCGACPDRSGTSCQGLCGMELPADRCQCNGQCPKYGNCCKDFEALCTDKPTCGDGKCTLGETVTCQSDCPPPAQELLPCLSGVLKGCLHTTVGCWLDQQCSGFLVCVATCKSAGCVQKCAEAVHSPTSLSFIADFGKCSGTDPPPFDAKACFAPFGGLPASLCGDGTCGPGESTACPADCNGTGPNCGNLKCEAGENWDDCWNDCPTPLSAVDQCLLTHCAASWYDGGMGTTVQCARARKCLEGGFDALDCLAQAPGHPVDSLAFCGKTQGCYAVANSTFCQAPCGQFVPGAHCQCIPECVKLGVCCKDFVAKCSNLCKTQADCAAGQVCCSTAGGKLCLTANACP